jgi:hypothetical protein
MSGGKLLIVSLVYFALGLALVYGVRVLEKQSETMALIVAVIFTPLLIISFLIVIYED